MRVPATFRCRFERRFAPCATEAVVERVRALVIVEGRVVRRSVADPVVRRRDLLFTAEIGIKPPPGRKHVWGIEEDREVTPPTGRQEHGGLERKPIGSVSPLTVVVGLEESPVSEALIGVVIDRRKPGQLPTRWIWGPLCTDRSALKSHKRVWIEEELEKKQAQCDRKRTTVHPRGKRPRDWKQCAVFHLNSLH